MAISSDRIFVHYATIRAECYLLSLVFAIIDGHPSQAVGLMELVNHILSFILKQHVRRYDSYQGAISLGVQERAQARHLLGDTSSGVQGQPLVLKLEVVGLALGYTTLIVEVVNPMRAYDRWWASFIDRPPQTESG